MDEGPSVLSCNSKNTDIARQLTLIITTSPTPSAPSVELLSTVLSSFQKYCPDLLVCRAIIVFDTYDHIRPKSNLKKGQVTTQEANYYDEYKVNVKQLFRNYYDPGSQILEEQTFIRTTSQAEYGSPGSDRNVAPYTVTHHQKQNITYIEPNRRLGFGLAVRTALRHATTPYVWVHQHDWAVAADIPIHGILDLMQRHEANDEKPIKYVCMPSTANLSYHIQADTLSFPALVTLTKQLKGNYSYLDGNTTTKPCAGVHGAVRCSEATTNSSISLTPMFFWPDKPHIADTKHYLARVFPSRYAIGRGDFIEDTIGHVARNQMKQGQWSKWATWLYYPDNGRQLCLRHLDGRIWRGSEREAEMGAYWKAKNRAENERFLHGNGEASRPIEPAVSGVNFDNSYD